MGITDGMELVMNQNERKHYGRLNQLGCIVCLRLGHGYNEPHIHHIRRGAGMGQKSVYTDAIPLCPLHHTNGGYGVAFHSGKKAFESKYGSETELLEYTNKVLGIISWN
jgi:hypothetical protein